MRGWAAWALVATASAFANTSGAGQGEAGAVSLRDLPEGRLSTIPPTEKAPAHVGAGEKVPGLFLARLPANQRGKMARNTGYSYVFATAEAAKEFTQGTGTTDQSGTEGCFVDGLDATSARADESGGSAPVDDWPASLSSALPLNYELPSKDTPRGRGMVRPVHAVKFVTDAAGKASLETTDAWVDGVTLGARLIGRTTVRLARIAVAPDGLEVYGARSGSDVLVVVREVDHPLPNAIATARLREATRALSLVLPGDLSGNSECGLAHFTLHGQKGAGEMATVQGVAVLPALEKDTDESKLPKLSPGEVEDDATKAERMLEGLRLRNVRANVSTSQTSADRDPLVSVAFGWNGKAAQPNM